MTIDQTPSPRPVDLEEGPYWPAVQWGAAAIAAIGLLLLLPAAAWVISAVGG